MRPRLFSRRFVYVPPSKGFRSFRRSTFVRKLTVHRRSRVCMQVETVLSPSARWLTDITAFVQAPEGLENRAKLEVSTYGSISQHWQTRMRGLSGACLLEIKPCLGEISACA